MDVIFDVDGTLANIEHRMYWVISKPKNWPAFNRAMVNDTPNHDIVFLLKMFYASRCRILVASGRSDDDRQVTVDWLNNVANISGMYQKLYMRKSKDYRSDTIVKSEILDQMYQDGYKPEMAIDDRSSVCEMWRSRGLRCLQVAPGDF